MYTFVNMAGPHTPQVAILPRLTSFPTLLTTVHYP